MNNDVVKMLEWLGEQYQFKPGYKKEDPEQSFRKMDAWFNRVYITMFTNLIKLSGINELYEEPAEEKLIVPKKYSEHEKEPDEQLPIKQTVTQPVPLKIQNKPIRKAGDKWAVRPWREQRNEHIKKLYMEAKQNRVPIDDGLMKRIAQIAGSTTTKVREIISLLEFDRL